MLFILRFVDKPDRLHLRMQYLDAHLSWLAERKQSVLVAGSLRVEPRADPMGALWIVTAESKADAETIFKSDPFWTNGLRASVEIMHWSKAFPNDQTLV